MNEGLIMFGASVFTGQNFYVNQPHIVSPELFETNIVRVQLEYDLGDLIVGPVFQGEVNNVDFYFQQAEELCSLCMPGDFSTFGGGALVAMRIGDGAFQFQPTVDVMVQNFYSPVEESYYADEIEPLFPSSSERLFRGDVLLSTRVGLDVRHPLWSSGPGLAANISAGFQTQLGLSYGLRLGFYSDL